jgi:hypothetical protein
MKCPACYNELTEIQVGPVLVDVCQGGCGGVWFDGFELQKVDETSEAGEPLLHTQRDERVVVDPARKRSCPRCPGIKLSRHFFSPKRQVEVDECPNCGGYWLDAGELERIRGEKAAEHATERARESSISSEFIRYIYRLEAEERERRRLKRP